jgi:hypothetical protein
MTMFRPLLLVAAVGVPGDSIAQVLPEPVEVVEVDAGDVQDLTDPVVVPEEDATSPADILHDIGKVINDWRTLGWLAGLIALINLLVNLLRLKPINAFLEKKDLKWVKPTVACVLGGVIGGLSTYQIGAPITNSIAAGVLTALGSVGFHELVSTLLKRTRRGYEKKPAPPKPRIA